MLFSTPLTEESHGSYNHVMLQFWSRLILTLVGYVYLTFDSEKSIKNLLVNCICDVMDTSQYYYKVCDQGWCKG
jgi:hypothetical protein